MILACVPGRPANFLLSRSVATNAGELGLVAGVEVVGVEAAEAVEG
jgi:hypothetical protein